MRWILILAITFFLITHLVFTNVYEKVLIQVMVGSNTKILKRPTRQCMKADSLQCLGMPSGHAEAATICCSLMYKFGIMPLYVAISIVAFVCAQRVVFIRHTLLQVVIGMILGSLYAVIYCNLALWKAAIIAVLVPTTLLINIMVLVDRMVHKDIPAWVDDSLIPLIEKKQGSLLGNKIFHVLWLVASHKLALFCTWDKLVEHMEYIIDVAKDKEYDVVVGIKTGGAIISTYIAKRLSLPCLHVKVSPSVYKCRKSASDTYDDIYTRRVLNVDRGFTVCEPVKREEIGRAHV